MADVEVDGRCESGGFARWLTRAGEERPRKLSRVVERQAVAVLLNRIETPRVTVMRRRLAGKTTRGSSGARGCRGPDYAAAC